MTVPNNANTYLPGVIQIPSTLQISSATQSNPLVLTVSNDPVTAVNTYQSGQLVYFNVPRNYGMYQLNMQTGQIINVNGNTLTINIDSSMYDPFVVPSITAEQPASIAPAGSRNIQFSNFTNNIPFQSLNDRGN